MLCPLQQPLQLGRRDVALITSTFLRSPSLTAAGPLDDLIGHSITYRIAVGPRAGLNFRSAMLIADVPAVFVGDGPATIIPMRLVHSIAAAIFVVLGVATLLGLALGLGVRGALQWNF
jgi:hypothetical protein